MTTSRSRRAPRRVVFGGGRAGDIAVVDLTTGKASVHAATPCPPSPWISILAALRAPPVAIFGKQIAAMAVLWQC
jgi:hypothetical protein